MMRASDDIMVYAFIYFYADVTLPLLRAMRHILLIRRDYFTISELREYA